MAKSLSNISLKIRKRETPFYDRIYRFGKGVQRISVPTIGPIHSFLYREWAGRTSLWHNFWRLFYYQPMFKSQCEEVGSGFIMHYAGNGIMRIAGKLKIYIGSNVTIFDNTSFVGLKVLDDPKLFIDNNTYIGPQVKIYVGKEVRIGKHTMITSRMITDNPGHSFTNVMDRLKDGGGNPLPDEIRPVNIGDYCFLPLDCVVYPGVTIGDGVVARIGTHINHDIPPFCLVAGNPSRIIRKFDIPEALKDFVGIEKYKYYKEEHKILELDKVR